MDENMNRGYYSMLRIVNTHEHSIYHVIKFQPHHVNGDFMFWLNSMAFRLIL